MNGVLSEESPFPLLVNKRAGGRKAAKLRRWLEARPERFTCYSFESMDEARNLVRRFAESGAPVVVAAGGDGTLNLVAQELAGSETAMGIIPSGTMNVFARELGLPVTDFEACYRILKEGKAREVDVFTANGMPFLQMCGVGFDARVVEETSWESKKRWGPLSYGMSAMRVFREKPPELVLKTEKGEFGGVFAVMGNGALYGGQMRLFPEAVYDDGLLDILLFKRLGWQLFSEIGRSFFQGHKRPDSRHVEYLRVSSCEVESSYEVPFELDGDVKGRTPVSLNLSAAKLKIIA